MVEIIIVGCGTQGRVHAKCYAKLKDMQDIKIVGVVDPKQEQLNAFQHLCSELGFDTRRILLKNKLSEISKELDISDSIFDVATPNICHYPCVKEAVDIGAKRIIIEKPLAHNIIDAKNIRELDGTFGVIENYVYSPITQHIQKILNEHKSKTIFAKTEFSKDRRLEATGRRGFSEDYIPHVFTIEMPHQIAVVSYLLGFPKEVCDAWCHDMILPDGRISSHGEGGITLAHDNGVVSYNFSCLQGHRHLSIKYRTIRVYCEDTTKIFGYYPTTIDLEGSILVYHGQVLVEKHRFIDDSMTETLKYLIECFMENKKPLTDVKFGQRVINIIDTSIMLTKKFR